MVCCTQQQLGNFPMCGKLPTQQLRKEPYTTAACRAESQPRSDHWYLKYHRAWAAYLPHYEVCANNQKTQQCQQVYELHWRLQALS